MLVYGSSFTFEPEHGPQQIINCVARWAGLRAKRSSVDSVILSLGIRELRLKDGSSLTSRVTLDEEQRPVYAQNESQSLSNDSRRRRTFTYRGRDFLMEKHLKIGVKDSTAETLRIHFEWLADENHLVVGYCGKHLDF